MLFSSLPTWPRRALRGVLGLVLLLLATLLIAWLALPAWIERSGTRIASEQLGRPVTLGAARIEPWRLGLVLEDLRIGGAVDEVPTSTSTAAATAPRASAPASGSGSVSASASAEAAGARPVAAGAPPQLAIRKIDVQLSPRSLWHLAPVLSSLVVEGPSARVALLADGRTDLDDILQRLAERPAQPDTAAEAGPPEVALYNIELKDGEFQLDDRVAGMTHRLSALHLGLPFLSTKDADVDVHVQPRLDGRINGVGFRSEAQARPFADQRTASLTVTLDALDLAAYRAYWPRELPLRLARGQVQAQLTIDFRQPGGQPPEVKLSGKASVNDLALQRRADGEVRDETRGDTLGETRGETRAESGWEDWLAWQSLAVDLADVQPLKRQVRLGAVTVQGPDLRLVRDAQGRVLMPEFATADASVAPAGAARTASAPASPIANRPAETMPWTVAIQQLAVSGGRATWTDQALRPTASLRLEALSVKGSALQWPPGPKAAPIELSATLGGREGIAPASLSGKGQLAASGLALDWALRDVALALLSDYLQPLTPLQLSGALAAKGSVVSGPTGEAPRFAIRDLALDGFKASDGPRTVVALQQLTLDQAAVVPGERIVSIGRVAATGPQLQLSRDQAGAWNWADWLRKKDAAGAASEAGATPAVATVAVGGAAATASDGGAEVKIAADWMAAARTASSARRSSGRSGDRLTLTTSETAPVLAPGSASATPQSTAASSSDAASASATSTSAASRSAAPIEPAGSTGSAASGPSARPAAGASTAVSTAAPTAAPPADRPWRLQLAELRIDGGDIALLDLAARGLDDAPARPVGVQALQLTLSGLDWDGRQLTRVVPVQLSATMRRPDQRRASQRAVPRLQWDGQLALAPLRARGQLVTENLPLHWADPYLDPSIGVHLQRAEGSVRGELALAVPATGPMLRFGGDVQVAELRLRQTRLQDGKRRSAEELLNWQSLKLAGLRVRVAPGRPPAIHIQQASLDDFYARIIISEQGRLNLRDLRQTEQGQAVAAAEAASASASTVAEPAGATPPATAASGPPVRLSIGETRIAGGQVDFTDRFVKPNYSARINELTGTLGSFSAGADAMAPLQLKGRVAGTGLLDINGRLNPSGAPLALDITASATDIELAPLSPYAGKYAGYAIERGKLSSRVHYRIDAGGNLVADNRVVLNQLTFGERIESPQATTLPVRLAVTLLKDRDGVIDLNLPVSGSINDPSFSVAGVVGKLIVNLLTRALTAPFSLFSGGGGGAETSELLFEPGSATLQPGAADKLVTAGRVLVEKPSLQLSITGWVDPAGERRAVQADRLEQALVAERRRELRRQAFGAAGASASAAASAPEATATAATATTTTTAAAAPSAAVSAPERSDARSDARGERPRSSSGAGADPANAPGQPPVVLDDAMRARLLKAVYDNAKLPDKPRNFLGLAKDLPAEEMRERLMDSYVVDDEQMRELALRRSIAVRDALIAQGVPNARLFLSSPKQRSAADSRDDKPWTPHVDLALSAQ